jgi:hypothetical protein
VPTHQPGQSGPVPRTAVAEQEALTGVRPVSSWPVIVQPHGPRGPSTRVKGRKNRVSTAAVPGRCRRPPCGALPGCRRPHRPGRRRRRVARPRPARAADRHAPRPAHASRGCSAPVGELKIGVIVRHWPMVLAGRTSPARPTGRGHRRTGVASSSPRAVVAACAAACLTSSRRCSLERISTPHGPAQPAARSAVMMPARSKEPSPQ